jgi:transposase
MGRAFSDDLRRRIATASERGEGSCRVLAKRFGVSWEYVRKVRQQLKRTGRITRQPQSRYGVPSRLSEPVKARMLALVEAQADITIDELREKIKADVGVRASWSSVQRWVKRLGLRLKKSRSTPASGTPKRTRNDAESSPRASGRSRRNV